MADVPLDLADITVRCAEHGPMRYREGFSWWDCPGFDGEGCRTKVTALEASMIRRGQPIEVGRSAHLGLPLGWQSCRSFETGQLDVTIYGPDAAEVGKSAAREQR